MLNKSIFTFLRSMELDNCQLSNLFFEWMKIDGPHLDSCTILHSGTSCSYEISSKMLKTVTISKNFYLIVHLLPFLLKLKKNIRQGKMTRSCIKTFKAYLRSIIFIAHLVGGLKLLKCMAVKTCNPLNIKMDGKIFLWGSFLSSLGLFWEDKIRREEITYFAFVRAVRSAYVFLKRRKIVSFENQMQILMILSFGLLSYIFHSNPQSIKFANVLEHIWGTS